MRLLFALWALAPIWADPTELDASSDAAVSCLQRHASNRERPRPGKQAGFSHQTTAAPSSSSSRGTGLPLEAEFGPGFSDPCGPEQPSTGFARLERPRHDTSDLFIDLTDVLQNGSVTVLVTAMSLDGAYSDVDGFDVTRAEPLEDTENSLLVLRLSKSGEGIDFYRPSLGIRTSDNQSEEAVHRGLGDGWLGSLERLHCLGNPRRIVISGVKLIWAGFFAASIAADAADYRILQVRGYAKNFDVSVEYLMSSRAPLRVGYSLVLLPEVPMAARPSDDRLLFFASEFQDLGYRQAAGAEAPSHEIDRTTTSIWRYNLEALPDQQIRIHVDPSVPERWREAFRQGIEAWNLAFAPLGHPQAVRGVVPGDEDWPQDYDMSDARFSTISWDLSDEVVSMGVAKVDPRSGEIVKGDITMSSGWVKAWLEDIDSLAPGLTHLVLPRGPGPASGLKLLQTGRGRHQRAWRRLERGHASRAALTRQKGSRRSAALNATAIEDLVATGLRAIVMHETGHILGLRHNFKGSLGISLDCLKAKACTSEHGLSASVMDYVPPNLHGADAESSLEVDVFTPVVGNYDKLAIAYGYRAVDQEAQAWPRVAPELQEILNIAEQQFEVCYDDDMDVEDPTCMAYDMSEDPIGFYEQEFARYVDVSKGLLEASVAPGEPLALYGEAVTSLLGRVESLAAKVVSWVGGIKDGYKHRGQQGELVQSRAPISRALQQRALALLFRLLRPKASGLLPPQDNLPYLVEGSASHDHVRSVDVSSIVHDVAGNVLESLLGAKRLLQIYRQQHLEGAQQSDVLSLDDMLRDLVGNILEPGLKAAGHGQDLDAQEMDLHFLLVRKLKNAYLRTVKNPKVDVRITKRAQDDFASKVVEVDPEEEPPELPEHISSKLLYYLQSARQLTKNSLEQLPHNTEAASFWKPCGELLGACVCTGLARLAVQGASSAIAFTPSIAVSDVIFCHNSSFPQVVWEDGVRGFRDSDSWCECLSLEAAGPSDVRTHLALLHREFADVFCEGNGGCSEARVSLPLAPAPPVEMESPFKATDAVAEGPKSKLTVKWFIIGISSALGIIFLSFVSYRLRYHGAIHG